MTMQLRATRARHHANSRAVVVPSVTQRLTHELGDALTVVVGYAHLVGDDPDVSDTVRRDLAEIVAAAERSAALAHSLLAARKAEGDRSAA
jgi:signal transduction histidine kinase